LTGAAFVDGAVAVVVLAVADFRGDRTASAAGVEQTFVYHAVAIVVLTVADFRAGWDAVCNTTVRSDSTVLGAEGSDAGVASILGTATLNKDEAQQNEQRYAEQPGEFRSRRMHAVSFRA
jgi:hypothetical protein